MRHPLTLSLLLVGLASLSACESTLPVAPEAELRAAKKGGGPPTGNETCAIHTDVTAEGVTLSGLCALVEESGDRFANARDVSALILKLNETADKLGEGKTEDAVQKLDDFIAKVVALRDAAKPKIDVALADQLIGQARALIAALQPAA